MKTKFDSSVGSFLLFTKQIIAHLFINRYRCDNLNQDKIINSNKRNQRL